MASAGDNNITLPGGNTHQISIKVNEKGEFVGIPDSVLKAIEAAGHTLADVAKNPSLVQELLYSLDYEKIVAEEAAKTQ